MEAPIAAAIDPALLKGRPADVIKRLSAALLDAQRETSAERARSDALAANVDALRAQRDAERRAVATFREIAARAQNLSEKRLATIQALAHRLGELEAMRLEAEADAEFAASEFPFTASAEL